ncbi:MAG TPA: hypothetical protein VHL51_10270 [Gaiellales bacterium]|jgi:hypothetical protein|nr:hypothetical protein [Gaiellales bacterium]
MGVSASILLIALGAILRFGVSLSGNLGGVTVDWAIVGDVLIAVGATSLVFSVGWMAAASRRVGPHGDRYQRTRPPYPS